MEHLTFAEIRSLFAELFPAESRDLNATIRDSVEFPTDEHYVNGMDLWYPKQVQVMIEIVENPDE